LPVISAQSGHIAVDLLDGLFPPRVARWREALISLVCGGMLWWPAERVVVLAERARSYGDVTEYLEIPQFYIAWFVAVMTYATMAALLVRAALLVLAPRALEEARNG
jgi:TRAP-type C4-dicarboxylate transport system permease small subunit